MLKRLSTFLEKYHIFNECQHGLRQGRSTMSAIHSFYRELMRLVNKGETSVGIFCDLSRIIDCVDHKILLAKLEHYGIRGTADKLFSSFLTSRSQYVEVRTVNTTTVSEKSKIKCGVPQATILGPVLFIICINDVRHRCEGQGLVKYADNRTKLVSSKFIQQNRLLLKTSKTRFLKFHNKQNKNQLVLPNIEFTNSTKFLGL